LLVVLVATALLRMVRLLVRVCLKQAGWHQILMASQLAHLLVAMVVLVLSPVQATTVEMGSRDAVAVAVAVHLTQWTAVRAVMEGQGFVS
jgi:hypothetical protein